MLQPFSRSAQRRPRSWHSALRFEQFEDRCTPAALLPNTVEIAADHEPALGEAAEMTIADDTLGFEDIAGNDEIGPMIAVEAWVWQTDEFLDQSDPDGGTIDEGFAVEACPCLNEALGCDWCAMDGEQVAVMYSASIQDVASEADVNSMSSNHASAGKTRSLARAIERSQATDSASPPTIRTPIAPTALADAVQSLPSANATGVRSSDAQAILATAADASAANPGRRSTDSNTAFASFSARDAGGGAAGQEPASADVQPMPEAPDTTMPKPGMTQPALTPSDDVVRKTPPLHDLPKDASEAVDCDRCRFDIVDHSGHEPEVLGRDDHPVRSMFLATAWLCGAQVKSRRADAAERARFC